MDDEKLGGIQCLKILSTTSTGSGTGGLLDPSRCLPLSWRGISLVRDILRLLAPVSRRILEERGVMSRESVCDLPFPLFCSAYRSISHPRLEGGGWGVKSNVDWGNVPVGNCGT